MANIKMKIWKKMKNCRLFYKQDFFGQYNNNNNWVFMLLWKKLEK